MPGQTMAPANQRTLDDRDPVVVAAVRTPIGRHGGALAAVRPDDLAAHVLRAAAERVDLDPHDVDEVLLGCANQAGEDNRNVARMAVLLAGFPDEVPGVTINRLCASGLTAVNHGARAIRAGEADIVIAGGVESMSRAPYALAKNPRPFGPSGNATAYDTSLGWRFPNPAMEARFPLEAMGETAENIVDAADRGELPGGPITREAQDAFALRSHERAVAAMAAGRFDDEIVPVTVRERKAAREVRRDEHPRYVLEDGVPRVDTSLDQLARLRPIFREHGSVTAGNASGMNDGAAALVLMSAAAARRRGVAPLARWLGASAVGVDPRLMGMGPVPASKRLLERFGLTVHDVDLVELNEAFAAQALAVMRALGLDAERTNVNGGAVALGHPLGASGARILSTLVHELWRRDGSRYGLATLCVGVGQGEATLVERL
jgi:3-oxoadipyl-CoA thiolase